MNDEAVPATTAAIAPRHLARSLSKPLLQWFNGPPHKGKQRLWRYVHYVLGRPRHLVKVDSGHWITADGLQYVDQIILENGGYEREVWDALALHARTGDAFWDIGSHIGSFALRACADPRISAIRAFEPNPPTRALLLAHLRMNEAERYEVLPLALGSREESRGLSAGDPTNSGTATLEPTVGQAVTTVAVRTVDGLVFDDGHPPPDLIKMDVEGWELEVLNGASRLFRERPPRAIAFEARCDRTGAMAEDGLQEWLESAGFRIERIPRPGGEMSQRENYLATRERTDLA